MRNTFIARYHECAVFCGMLFWIYVLSLVFVSEETLARTFDIILAAHILSVPSFFFCPVPQVPSGLWVTSGGVLWRLGYPRIS